jgi:N-acyl-D-aspartate/D-glutamate deacylase
MTLLLANHLKLRDPGRILPGQAADSVVFDPAKIRDTATFANL